MEDGTIINIGSVASLAGGYGAHAYTAAKFRVVGSRLFAIYPIDQLMEQFQSAVNRTAAAS